MNEQETQEIIEAKERIRKDFQVEMDSCDDRAWYDYKISFGEKGSNFRQAVAIPDISNIIQIIDYLDDWYKKEKVRIRQENCPHARLVPVKGGKMLCKRCGKVI